MDRGQKTLKSLVIKTFRRSLSDIHDPRFDLADGFSSNELDTLATFTDEDIDSVTKKFDSHDKETLVGHLNAAVEYAKEHVAN